MAESSSKPYQLRPRVFAFACDVVRACPRERLDPISLKVWSQLVAAATSVGAHLEEAAGAGTRVHYLSLTRGALREMREAHYWLRVLTTTQLHGFDRAVPLVEEANELVAILVTIIKRTQANSQKQNPSKF